MKFRILIATLLRAAEHRPEGYLEDVKSKGELKGDSLLIPADSYRELLKKYRIGSKVESVAKPIAKVVDSIFGTDLQNCVNCGNRKKQWDGE